MTYKERKADKRYLNVNINGNKKLRNNENIRFIIWNLPTVETCPYRTALCEKSCYARKAERIYPEVIFSRKTNLKRSLQESFVENMIFTIETELNTKKFKNKKVIFRIHESGDFYNLEYTAKWLRIVSHFEKTENLVFVAYTKSIEYFVALGYGKSHFPKNLQVISSLWEDTNLKNTELTMVHEFPVYTALNAKQIEKATADGLKFAFCDCVDCATCGKCWNKEYKNIIVKIH